MHRTEKDLIRESWKQVRPIGPDAMAMFYSRLFETDPDTRDLFRHADMEQQHAKLLAALDLLIDHLDDPDTIDGVLRELGRKHAGYGVTEAQYASVGEALLWTLEQGLGEAWTIQIKTAWSALYGLVATTMISGARDRDRFRAA